MTMKQTRLIYQLHVTLQEIDPPIWRRIQIWEDTTLGRLHRILQTVMGWEDYHLHQFVIGRRIYSVPDPDDAIYERRVIDERRKRLCDLVPRVGARMEYVYDFGDNWRHDLLLEAILLPELDQQYPRCAAGKRRGPPEDVGGSGGYQDYLEAMANPKHREHEHWLGWRGPFNPEAFSLAAVNQQLRKELRLPSDQTNARKIPNK